MPSKPIRVRVVVDAAFTHPLPLSVSSASPSKSPRRSPPSTRTTPRRAKARRADRRTSSTPPPPSATATRVCRVCKKTFVPEENNPHACRFHPAAYSGRLLRVTPTDTSDLQFFYDCCGQRDKSAPGCSFAYHQTYDD